MCSHQIYDKTDPTLVGAGEEEYVNSGSVRVGSIANHLCA